METTFKLPNNRVLSITFDETPLSPREWDNITTLIFFGKYSHLGDSHEFNTDDYGGWDEMEAAIKKHYGKDLASIQKVYGYSHSGLAISTTPFQCPWDSGVLGFAVILRSTLKSICDVKRITNAVREQMVEWVNGEIEVLNQYANGEVYRFVIEDENQDYEDGCSGFYGHDIQTNGILDNLSEEDKAEVLTQL